MQMVKMIKASDKISKISKEVSEKLGKKVSFENRFFARKKGESKENQAPTADKAKTDKRKNTHSPMIGKSGK